MVLHRIRAERTQRVPRTHLKNICSWNLFVGSVDAEVKTRFFQRQHRLVGSAWSIRCAAWAFAFIPTPLRPHLVEGSCQFDTETSSHMRENWDRRGLLVDEAYSGCQASPVVTYTFMVSASCSVSTSNLPGCCMRQFRESWTCSDVWGPHNCPHWLQGVRRRDLMNKVQSCL